MENKLNFKPPFDVDVNVNIKHVKKGKIVEEIDKHNKATFNMISGIVKFLRGEFNNTTLNISSIGYDGANAKYYIPSYIGFGNGGTGSGVNKGTLLPSDENSGFKYLDNNTLYTSNALDSEIFKKFDSGNGQENHRIPIQRSTFNSSSRNSMEVLTISSTISFSQIKNYYSDSNFYYQDNSPVKWLNYSSLFDNENKPVPDAEFKLAITELGLFSGDLNDTKSRLLAKLVLSSNSPLIVDSTSTIIVNWMLGVYSINDMLYRESKEGSSNDLDYYDYKYTEKPTTFTNAVWGDHEYVKPVKSLTLNANGTYTAVDDNGDTHTIIPEYDSNHKIVSLTYDDTPISIVYDSNGNLIQVADLSIDVSLYK